MEYSQLIKDCKKGKLSAQMLMYHQFKDMMFNTSYRILRDREMAKDVVHDSFIKAFEALSRLDTDAQLAGWLKRITINRSIDVLKNKQKLCFDEDWTMFDMSINHDTESDLVEHLSVSKIRNQIDTLPEKYRLVVLLHLVEGEKHKDIAELLNKKESTIRNQYVRGKKILLEALKSKKV